MSQLSKTLPPITRAGMVRFIRYGFMPNRLGYCGPDQNSLLFQYGVAGEAHPGLAPVLTKIPRPAALPERDRSRRRHWGWICEVISAAQACALKKYSELHLALANETI